MKTTISLGEFEETCDTFQSSVQAEKELGSLEQMLIADFGLSRSRHVALHLEMRADGCHAVDALLADPQASVRMINEKRQELDDLRIRCEALAHALEETRGRRKRAAENTATAASALRKCSTDLLEARHGKRHLFFRWTDELEQAYLWRKSMLGQLLALASNDADRGCALLLCFFREKEGFGLCVTRAFRAASDEGVREIRPTGQGDVYQVPRDLPYREGFEALLTGRAELVGAAK